MKTLIKNGKVVLPDCSGYKSADILICDEQMNIEQVILRGECVL